MRLSEKLPLITAVSRWFRRPLQRRYEIRTLKVYWAIKNSLGKLRFYGYRSIFGTRWFFEKQSQSASIIRVIIKTVSSQFLFALVIIISLELIQRNLPLNLEYYFNEAGARYARMANRILREGSYSTLLTTYAQIAGILLGLYFAGISAVLSTAYANVPDNVREKLINEKFGNVYIKVVALFGGIALILLITIILGYEPGVLNIVFVSVLGLVALLGFVNLGLRTFVFFNPTALSKDLYPEIIRWIKAATPKGFRFKDVSFQNYYRIRAEEYIDTIINIIELACPKKYLKGKPLNELSGNILAVMAAYTLWKNQIPGNSYWFRRKLQFPNWLTAGHSEVEIAVKTGTAIKGKEIPDLSWFEEITKKGIVKINAAHLENNDLLNVADLYNNLCSYYRFITSNYGCRETQSIWVSLNPKNIFLRKARPQEYETGESQKAELMNKLGCIDTYWAGFLNIILGFFDSIRREEIAEFHKTINDINWENEKAIYLTNVPREVLTELESLQNLINNELKIERSISTAPWYQRQLALRGLTKYLDSGLNTLVKTLEENLIPDCEYYIENEEPFLASHSIQSGLEACAKLQSHLKETKAIIENVMRLKKVEDYIFWPTLDLSNYENRIKRARELLVIKLAQSAEGFYDIDYNPDFPDYFGQIYCYIAQECYETMASGNEKIFEIIFPPYFNLCLTASEKLRQSLTYVTAEDRFGFMVQPLQDLISLSGYAMIYSDLYNKGFNRITRALWEKYFAGHGDLEKIIGLLHYIITHPFVSFRLYARGIQRTAWEQDFSNKLKSAGIEYLSYEDMLLIEPRTDIYVTPLIRAVVKQSGHLRLFDPRVVFGGLFLKSYFDKAGKELTWEFDSFLKAFSEESRSNPDRSVPPDSD